MSRLLDVLRHAEDTRPAPDSRPGAATQRHPPSELALEPIARKTSAAPEPISANGTAPPAPHHQVACPSPASPSRSARIRAFLPGLAGAAALAGLAFGIWLELQPLARADLPPRAGKAPITQQPPEQEDSSPMPQPPATPALAGATAPSPTSAAAQPARPRPPKRSAPSAHAAIEEAPATPHIRAGRPADQAALMTSAAHAAYMTGDRPAARELYMAALLAAPTDADALRGLGTIALQERRLTDAAARFTAALHLDPTDAMALAGLSLARPDTVTEARLRLLSAEQPDAPAPHVALAERLAGQHRWSEARRSYARAHALVPSDPDIAYNLAVSLDRAGQSDTAAAHYRTALDLAARHRARFDTARCAARLHALEAQEAIP